MKKRTGLLTIAIATLLVGCSSDTIDRSYSCATGSGYISAHFHENGYVDLGLNGNLLSYKYTKVDKDVYEITHDGVSYGFVGVSKDGMMVTDNMTAAKGTKLPCMVE